MLQLFPHKMKFIFICISIASPSLLLDDCFSVWMEQNGTQLLLWTATMMTLVWWHPYDLCHCNIIMSSLWEQVSCWIPVWDFCPCDWAAALQELLSSWCTKFTSAKISCCGAHMEMDAPFINSDKEMLCISFQDYLFCFHAGVKLSRHCCIGWQ